LTLDGQAFTLFTLTDISDEVRRRELERIFFHDLLNAAGIVRATSDLMMDVYRSETEDAASLVEQGTTMVGLIQRVANRLVREIEAQKDFTQLERNEIEIEPASLRSQALLDDLITGFRMHEVARDRTLRLAPGSEDVRFTSDRALLSRVIENMIKNALEAVDSGETVTVGSRRAAEGVEFWVHNPTVMPERIRRQVFKRSFSTKGPGRGLGTFSMRLISERYLQGHVTFTSEPGEGTTFYAHYPLTLETERDS
jgi:signal transduction histidine kinase